VRNKVTILRNKVAIVRKKDRIETLAHNSDFSFWIKVFYLFSWVWAPYSLEAIKAWCIKYDTHKAHMQTFIICIFYTYRSHEYIYIIILSNKNNINKYHFSVKSLTVNGLDLLRLTLSLAVRKRGSSWNASLTNLLKRLNNVRSCSTYFSESCKNKTSISHKEQ